MQPIINILNRLQDVLDALRAVDFLGPLALRLYLVPVFWVAGTNKLGADSLAPSPDIVSWFGNPDWGLGLPAPELMAWLATYTEIIGAVLLLLGLAVRWVSIPLMVQMLVATFSVHWENGWQAVADPMSPFPPADIGLAMERLDAAKSILREHGNYDWLTGSGSFVISNNGIEWAVTYFVMLLALFFIGGGRWLSVDHWIHRRFRDNT